MKKMIVLGIGIVLLIGGFVSVKYLGLGYKKVIEEPLKVPEWRKSVVIENANYIEFSDEYDIIKDTDELGGAQSKYYSKYIEYIAPNGKPIRIVAMNQITDDQMLYAFDLLSFYLMDTDSLNKSEIANKMADNKSILILPNGADRDGKTPMLAMSLGQNLNQSEISNIGSKWYIDNDYDHRDAAFEEIFHMVHDYGIGTSKNPQAAPSVAKDIADAMATALPAEKVDWGKKGKWGLDSKSWLVELSKEGSLEQEYIVSVIDSYYGLWEPWTDGDGGMWGMYVAQTREELKTKDPNGLKAIESILPKYINQMMRIDSNFEGDFYMTKDESKPYTFKSQYLQNVYLSGSNNSNIIGNNLDNVLMGNSGNNIINGGAGQDIYQLRDPLKEYTIEYLDGETIVTDLIDSRDGVTTLINIEIIRGTDVDHIVG